MNVHESSSVGSWSEILNDLFTFGICGHDVPVKVSVVPVDLKSVSLWELIKEIKSRGFKCECRGHARVVSMTTSEVSEYKRKLDNTDIDKDKRRIRLKICHGGNDRRQS